jgi:hypothetical protein
MIETRQSVPTLQSWLQHLLALTPPTGVTYVGAGNGSNPWIKLLQDAKAPNVTLVEGDDMQYQQLQRGLVVPENWRLVRNVVAAESSPVVFYRASIGGESGLLEPEGLRLLWPNIQTRDKQTRHAVILSELLQETAGGGNWLFVDCLPALPLIQGAASQLDNIEVIVARMLLDDSGMPASLSDQRPLQDWLNENGFRLLIKQEGHHPALGYGLFVRDQQSSANHLRIQVCEATKKQQELDQQLSQARSDADKQKTPVLRQQNEQLTQKTAISNQLSVISAIGESNTQRLAIKQLELNRLRKSLKIAQENGRPSATEFKLSHKITMDLGEAWAGNTVNTVIFRHHGLLTQGLFQYTAFYVDDKTLRFVRRRLSTDELDIYDLPGNFNLRDAHNSISLGMDRKGILHVSYDHHASKLRYRRSLEPHSITGWTDDLTMTGQHEDKVTYPTFILPREEHPLTLLYRDGRDNKGSARLKTYDEDTQTWKDRPEPILSGAEHKPWTSNAYWNHPAIGNDGSLHLSFVWRTGMIGNQQLVNNVNIGYAWSPDNGWNWFTALGQINKLPITQVTAETVWPVPPGSNLINQTSMALDSCNFPHIVFYANDADGIPQYQHIWFDGKEWRHQYLSNRTQAFNLQGGGTLRIPISRPEIVLDDADNAYVIYRGDLSGNRMQVTFLPAPRYTYQARNNQVLSEEDLAQAEPVIDRQRWQHHRRLALLLQCNEQPDHDVGHKVVTSPVTLIEATIEIE